MNMKRKWLYIIFSCVFLGFLLFVVNIFTTERKKEKNTEFPVIYNVEYMEYKEEQWDRFKIYVPYVENLGNQDLEKTINKHNLLFFWKITKGCECTESR